MTDTRAAPTERIDRTLLEAAVWSVGAPGGRSDFDLSPEMRGLIGGSRALRPAAVLCPVVERRTGFAVILTRRSERLQRHPGQIAFPGGKIDPTDPSPLAAALREAEEEIGLAREQVDVLGAIDPYETSTGFRVLPFVGLVHPAFRPIADDGEVAEVFEAPLDFLMDPANRELRRRVWRGAERAAYAIPWNGYDIWGATAGMLTALAHRIESARRRREAVAEPPS